jgi:hypothetical protein
MKVGDLIRWRRDWRHINHVYNEAGVAIDWDVEAPRQDDEGWSQASLVLRKWAEMWIVLDGAEEIVVSPKRGLTAVEVISNT